MWLFIGFSVLVFPGTMFGFTEKNAADAAVFGR